MFVGERILDSASDNAAFGKLARCFTEDISLILNAIIQSSRSHLLRCKFEKSFHTPGFQRQSLDLAFFQTQMNEFQEFSRVNCVKRIINHMKYVWLLTTKLQWSVLYRHIIR